MLMAPLMITILCTSDQGTHFYNKRLTGLLKKHGIIHKVAIACFIPTISVGSTLTRVKFITWTTQYTCWLVVRSCVYAMVLNTKFLDSSPGIISVVKSIDHNFVHQVFGAVAGDCSSLDN